MDSSVKVAIQYALRAGEKKKNDGTVGDLNPCYRHERAVS